MSCVLDAGEPAAKPRVRLIFSFVILSGLIMFLKIHCRLRRLLNGEQLLGNSACYSHIIYVKENGVIIEDRGFLIYFFQKVFLGVSAEGFSFI